MTCSCGGEFCYTCGLAYPLPNGHRHDRDERPRLNPQGIEVAPPPARAEQASARTLLSPDTERTVSEVVTVPPRTADEARARITALLTLRCPNARCASAICMDEAFDQCFALRCASCPTNFCAWCFRITPEGEDPHSHVLDCAAAPEDMRGSSLYLHDDNGGPHVPPNPHNKFTAHWRAVQRRQALALIESAEDVDASDKAALTEELDALMNGVCVPCS